MIAVKVTYTVNEAYVDTNKEMIAQFLKDFKALDNTQFVYSIFQAEDRNTFTHISQYRSKEIQEIVLHVPSFLRFQQQRDENLVSDVHIQPLGYVGSSREAT